MKRMTRQFALGLALFGLAGMAVAQDENQEPQTTGEAVEMTVIAGDETGGAPMVFATRSSFGEGGESSGMRIMSGGPGSGMTFIDSAGGAFGGGAPDPWSMLSNPSVQKDLELVGDQLKQVEDMQSDFARQMKEQIGDLSKGGFSPDRFKGLGEMIKQLKAEQQEKLEGLLLPHQISRLKQVALQTHMKNAGAAGALGSSQLAEELGITEEQQERLKEKAKEINKKLVEDTAKLKADAREELLKELTPDQRSKLKEMMGDKYEPQSKDWKESMERFRRPRRTERKRGN